MPSIIFIALERISALPLGLMDPYKPEEVILHRHQVQQQGVAFPRESTHRGACYGIEDEVVGGCYDSGEDDGWVCDAEDETEETARGRNAHAQTHGQCYGAGAAVLGGKRYGQDG